MRKYRNGLCAIIQSEMAKDVFTRSLFVFVNRRGNIIRFLYWDDTGFAVWTKCLDRQRYRWPRRLFEENSLGVSKELLQNLLLGMDITCHKKVEYQSLF